MAETELIQALQAQDSAALTALYQAYSPALYGIILRIVRAEPTAEDVLQECFLKIWITFHLYDQAKGRLFTWLINIARHLAIDKTRSRTYLQELKTQKKEASSLAERLGHEGFRPEHIGLRKVVDQLAIPHKTIIYLMYFEGYTQSEIAQQLSIPLGTVKTRARQALQRLRKLI
ncbi:hypothetical protein AHMF7605_11530 [Adhaeribacter arboris]|uniref:RNA polymerase subunit sigma-70 n=2 Tax=Adhaeribacter arboris TaxID=2072846 RepID=A0A2T2YP57_9BACT|nr:hypothetical protein AHMF7605_11530 [Adhaeribacter arboris]